MKIENSFEGYKNLIISIVKENEFKELNENIFKKAIFETIRLWCISEYNYSKEFIKAFELYNPNSDWGISEDLNDLYNRFLNDYSIARTRLTGKNTEILKIIFNKLKDNKVFSPKIVDDIAIELKTECTPNNILPISLVSKTVFLVLPKDTILYDSRGIYSLHKIFKGESINDYQEYYNLFINLYNTNKVKALILIEDELKSNKQTIKDYFSTYYKLFKTEEYLSSFSIMDEENTDWLFNRCLDKYLWYYYEYLISIKKNK